MSMTETKLHTSTSCSSSDTDSTQTQSGLVSPPIRNSITFDNLTKKHKNQTNYMTAATVAAVNPSNQQLNTQSNTQSSSTTSSTFRKCRSFIHLTTAGKCQSSLFTDTEQCNRLRKTASTPNAIYMAIKQEHHLLVHRIFNRCKVNFSFG